MGRLKLVFDTNVLLDVYLDTRPGHKDAQQLALKCADGDCPPLYAAHSLKDVFYVARRQVYRALLSDGECAQATCAEVARSVAWAYVRDMRDWATPIGADMSDLWLADKQQYLHDDFEDNMVLAAAIRAKADYLVTSDRQLLRDCAAPGSFVRAITPQEALGLLERKG